MSAVSTPSGAGGEGRQMSTRTKGHRGGRLSRGVVGGGGDEGGEEGEVGEGDVGGEVRKEVGGRKRGGDGVGGVERVGGGGRGRGRKSVVSSRGESDVAQEEKTMESAVREVKERGETPRAAASSRKGGRGRGK